MAAEYLSSVAQNFLYEIMHMLLGKIGGRLKYSRFVKKLSRDIMSFCSQNECMYLNSSAFLYFVDNFQFVQKIIEREMAADKRISRKDFIKEATKTARRIAEAENVQFSHNEEHLIRNLFDLLSEKISVYYDTQLSDTDKIVISKCLDGIMTLQSDISDGRDENRHYYLDLKNSVMAIGRIGEQSSLSIIRVFVKKYWAGEYGEIDNLMQVLCGKSDDIEHAVLALNNALRDAKYEYVLDNIKKIESNAVRDEVIRAVAPIMLFKKNSTFNAEIVQSASLKEVMNLFFQEKWDILYGERIEKNTGMEMRTYELNKRFICEEEWLLRQLFVLYLSQCNIRNVADAMKQAVDKSGTWLSDLLIANKEIDVYSNNVIDNLEQIKSVAYKFIERESYYNMLGIEARVLYYTIKVKYELCANEGELKELNVPDELLAYSPLDDFNILYRLNKAEISVNTALAYCEKNGKYWIIARYFSCRRKPREFVAFFENNNKLIEDAQMFFMYTGALHEVDDFQKLSSVLEGNKERYGNYYEFWNAYLAIDSSDMIINGFIEKCHGGKMTFLFEGGMWYLVQMLLKYKEYDLANEYSEKLKLFYGSTWRVKKYQAAIQLGKGNIVEALELFKAAFDGNIGDPYVIDNSISISLQIKRAIDQKYIDAAIKIGNSRMFYLVAAAYMYKGKKKEARIANIKALLLGTSDDSGAYGQYWAIDMRTKEKIASEPDCMDEDTAAFVKDEAGNERFLCIHADNVLPESPYLWNGDVHMYVSDAAGYGMIRSRVGKKIVYENNKYTILQIISLRAYFSQKCIAQLHKQGHVKMISIPTVNGKINISGFKAVLKEHSPDEKVNKEWLDQYGNVGDIPLPLYIYKRFGSASYTQFVDFMLEDSERIIRDIDIESKKSEKYVLTFAVIILLYKIGVPIEIVKRNAFITESAFLQISNDVEEIIQEYNRDEMSSIGFYDGNLFYNSEEYKTKWIYEAGKIRSYAQAIPQKNNCHDLSFESYKGVDLKELLGVCDYDAMGVVVNEAYLGAVVLEMMPGSIFYNEPINLPVTTVTDWLITCGVDVIDLLGYMKSMIEFGCIHAISVTAFYFISGRLQQNETDKDKIYEAWDDFLESYGNIPDKYRNYAVQQLSIVFSKASEAEDKIDFQFQNILIDHLLKLSGLQARFTITGDGRIKTGLYRLEDGTPVVIE